MISSPPPAAFICGRTQKDLPSDIRPVNLAQLSRFFCLTPDEPLRFASRPLVHFSGPMPGPPPAPTRPPSTEEHPDSVSVAPETPMSRSDRRATPTPLDADARQHAKGEGEEFPSPGNPVCISFSPAEPMLLPPSSFVAIRFPVEYGVSAASSSRSLDVRGQAEATGVRHLLQLSPRKPYAAWLEAGSALFPA